MNIISTELFVPLDKVLKCCLSHMQAQLIKCQLSLSELSYLRVCLPQYASSATCVPGTYLYIPYTMHTCP